MRRAIVPQCYSSCVSAITSRQNPIVARFRAAANGEADGLLLDGTHLVAEAIGSGIRVHEAAVVGIEADRADVAELADRLRRQQVPVATVSAMVMSALSPVRSASPIVAVAERPRTDSALMYHGTPLILIALDVQDPGNLGAIVRVAEAGGATGVVCAGSSADPFGWKALRGSMGSSLRLPTLITRDPRDAVDDARRHGCRILAAAPHEGGNLFETDLRQPLAVLIGSEGSGLTPSQLELSDQRVVIPMSPPVESLNAAVSAALIVYEARRQRAEPGRS
jgi:TrmH family RNA methyltransferase